MQKINFCSYLGKRTKKGHFILFFEKFFIWFSKQQSEKRIMMILNFPSQILCLAKFWVLCYYPKCSRPILSNISRIIRGIKLFFFVSRKSTGLGLTWLGLARLIQNYTSEMYSKDSYGQAFFAYWTPINRGSYKITVICCLSLFR